MVHIYNGILLLLLSRFSRVWLCATPETAAHQAPPSLDSPGKNTVVGCLQCMKVKSESEATESCLTLSDPMDCRPPGSSVHGIFQARVQEWGAIAFSDNGNYSVIKRSAFWVSSDEVDEPRAYYTEWSKWGREKPVLYINVLISMVLMNLFTEQQWRYRLMDKGGGEEGEGEMNGESRMDAYILTYVNRYQREFAVWLRELRPGLCNNLDGVGMGERWREIHEGGDKCTTMVNSFWCMTDSNQYCNAIMNQLKQINDF